MYKRDEKIKLRQFVPERVMNNKGLDKSYDLRIIEDDYLSLSYDVPAHNQTGLVGKREFSIVFPASINRNRETFEVLGLLQAEMGKKQDGKINFCNHEYQIINKVVKWFEDQLSFPKENWNCYIKVNINEPEDENYRKDVEDKVVHYWINKSGLPLEQYYPKKVSYVKHNNHKKLKFYDYGTLIIEKRGNIFSQVIKNLVKQTTQNILNYRDHEIRDFMRGIIAGESNVEFNQISGHYRIFISAKYFEERQVYYNCLKRLEIESTNYPKFHGLVISKKENNLELLKQQLMTLSHEKYNKFLSMMNRYEDFVTLKLWRGNLQKPHNKIPDHIVERIEGLYYQNPSAPA